MELCDEKGIDPKKSRCILKLEEWNLVALMVDIGQWGLTETLKNFTSQNFPIYLYLYSE